MIPFLQKYSLAIAVGIIALLTAALLWVAWPRYPGVIDILTGIEEREQDAYLQERDALIQQLDVLTIQIGEVTQEEERLEATWAEIQAGEGERLDAISHADNWGALDDLERLGRGSRGIALLPPGS